MNQNGQVISTNGNTSGGVTPPSNNPSWAVEEALDVEWAHAIAPGASIVLVEANNASMSNLLTAVTTAATKVGASVVSMSWGGNESSSETSFDSDFTAPGVPYVAASGDNGAPPIYPAVSPNVLAVGGTSLTLNSSGGYGSETAWSGSGGGISAYEPLPSYQPRTYSNGSSTGTSTTRMNPDVAYDANPNTGFAVYDSDGEPGWLEVGGTSDAAPQWAALVAIADQGRALNGKGTLTGSTQTLPMLYQMPSSNFHEITSGGNGTDSAGPGYNLVTGLGTPVANEVINYFVNGSTSPPPPTTPPAPTGLTATAVSSSQINLSWNPDSGATDGYLIDRSLTGAVGSFTQIGSTTATTFSNNGLNPSTTYYYEVFAVNSVGDSPPSNIASATTQASSSSGLLPDGGFESPVLTPGTYVLDPTGTPWTFSGTAGIASNGSSITVDNPPAPQGTQVGFLSGFGSGFTQTVNLSTGTYYTISFDAANAGITSRTQQFAIAVDNTIMGMGTAASTQYTSYSTVSFYVTASGAYTITFVGTNSRGGIALIDDVSLNVTPAVKLSASLSGGQATTSLSGNAGVSSSTISTGVASHATGVQAPSTSNQPSQDRLNLGAMTNLFPASSPHSIAQLFFQTELEAIMSFNTYLSSHYVSPIVTGLRPPSVSDPFAEALDWE
ncbi:MAG TPA: fibronectin type III domain-containing protein [Gemmataceae bacterium]